jgi:hypothetical protein
MNDWDKVKLAFDILENADVTGEFDDCVWIRIDRDLWEAFNSEEQDQ